MLRDRDPRRVDHGNWLDDGDARARGVGRRPLARGVGHHGVAV